MIKEVELIKDLIRVKGKVGKNPSMREYKRHGEYSVSTLANRFGSWNEAKEVASMELNPQKISKDELKEDIVKVAKEIGKEPTEKEYRKHGEFSIDLAQKKFDSWDNAKKVAGVKEPPALKEEGNLIELFETIVKDPGVTEPTLERRDYLDQNRLRPELRELYSMGLIKFSDSGKGGSKIIYPTWRGAKYYFEGKLNVDEEEMEAI